MVLCKHTDIILRIVPRPTGPKYKKEYKDQMKLSPFLKEALIGLI